MLSILQRFDDAFWRGVNRPSPVFAVSTLPGAAVALAAISLAMRGARQFTLIVVEGVPEQDAVYGDLCTFAKAARIAPRTFPHMSEDDADAMGRRLRIICELDALTKTSEPMVLVASVASILQKVPDPRHVENDSIRLTPGATYTFDTLVERLVSSGYARVNEVTAPGEIAVRGGVFDAWAPAEERPWRAEFFGDTLESLRSFDPASQISTAAVTTAWLPPCAVAEAAACVSVLDCIPGDAAIVWVEHNALAEGFAAGRSAWARVRKQISARHPWKQIFTGDPPPAAMPTLDFEIAALPGFDTHDVDAVHHPELLVSARRKALDVFAARAQQGECVMLCVDTHGACELLARELGDASAVCVKLAALSGGFSIPGLTLATQTDLYAPRKRRTFRAPQPGVSAGGRVSSAMDLEPGDLVVHVDHGIGRFLGSTEIEIDGRRSEVFSVEYADGAKLHVPVAHAHLLSRYVGVAGHKVKLHRLDGRRWLNEKADAERAVADLAASLLETQARRSVVQGQVFNPEPAWMSEFEAAFPYQETVDQTKVIAEIKHDMAAPRPMDRLICGDAGYGKTEVAMRAAFIAVMNGKQVAVLAPTTVLAEQHVETFRDRMSAYPVRIAALSRFQKPSARADTIAATAAGQVDIVIGTHALLSPTVKFHDLGLLIIDEEQRFGVKHKELLKIARHAVDVLTLSATPIPRTLYMSMTGARDLSLLQTPPRERVAVETKVARDSDRVIEQAIRQELNRNGQVYFLYNRVVTIGIMAQRIRQLVPEARVAVAHGQMASAELAEVMQQFAQGAVDVLLCTTIVESGLDIPRANTILIHRADRFGIAELYQLRGRVGRSAQKGYAWLLIAETGFIDNDARQRIAALRKHSGLGAGFNLALRDLEIRGAGNLLGAAQSGHIVAIGFGLYCQLLKRTIARMKGETVPLLVDVALDLDFLDLSPGAPDDERSACLPYNYMDDEAHRMMTHRRLAEATDVKEVRALRVELADRYGRLPKPVVRLIRLAELRIVAARKKVTRIETRGAKLYIYQDGSRMPSCVGALRGKTAERKLSDIFARLDQNLA